MTLAFTVLFLALLNPVLGKHCNDPCPVEAFSSTYQGIMNSTYSNSNTDQMVISGEEAGQMIANQVYNEISPRGLEDAQQIVDEDKAEFAAKFNTLSLMEYFGIVGDSFAAALYHCGLLDCKNVVPQALKFAKYVRSHLEDPDEFEDYFKAANQGRDDFFDNVVQGSEKCGDYKTFSNTQTEYFRKTINDYSKNDEV